MEIKTEVAQSNPPSQRLTTAPSREERQQEILRAYGHFENAFGINIVEASAKNVRDLRNRLGELTEQEQQLAQTFSALPMTIRHTTRFLEQARNMGALMSLQERGRLGDSTENAGGGTGWSNGDDNVYFTIGTGNHSVPDYLLPLGGDIITVPVTDEVLDDGLWIGPHLSAFKGNKQLCRVEFGDTVRWIDHLWESDGETLDETIVKTYRYQRSDGTTVEQCFGLGDEIFAGRDVIPGMAFKLIEDLRNIGGSYQQQILSKAADRDFIQHVFNTHFDSWDYPEARMPTRMRLDVAGCTIQHHERHPLLEELYDAARKNDVQTLRSLVARGVPIEVPLGRQASVIQRAALSKNNEAVAALLDLGASITGGAFPSLAPLSIMRLIAIHCDPQIISRCLKHKEPHKSGIPNVFKRVELESDHLLRDLWRTGKDACAALLISERRDWTTRGGRAVNMAIREKHYEEALHFLEKGAPADSRYIGNMGGSLDDFNYMNPIMMLASQPEVQVEDQEKLTALVKRLVASGCPLDARFEGPVGDFAFSPYQIGRTALFMAVASGNHLMVKELLRLGASPNIPTLLGQTALNLLRRGSVKAPQNKVNSIGEMLVKHDAVDVAGDLPAESVPTKQEREQERHSYQSTVAAVILAVNESGELCVLMGRKRDERSRELGPYLFPGGEVEPSDRENIRAAIRETFQETGVNLYHMCGQPTKEGRLLHSHETVTIGSLSGGLKQHSHHTHQTFIFQVNSQLVGKKTYGRDDIAMSRLVPLSSILEVSAGEITNYFVKETTGECTPVLRSNGAILNALDPESGTLDKRLVGRINADLAIEDEGTLKLCQAIDVGDRLEIERLINEVGVDISRTENVLLLSEFGVSGGSVSPLTVAVAKGDIEVMRMLAQRGADIQGRANYLGSTAYYAVLSEQQNRHAVLRELLKLGASPDGRPGLPGLDTVNKTPLMWAIERRDDEMAAILIEAGASPNLIDGSNGDTALRLAVSCGNKELVKRLLAVGASEAYHYRTPFYEEPKFVSLIEEAFALGNHEIVKLLIEGQLHRAASGEVQATPTQMALHVLARRIAALLPNYANAGESFFLSAHDEANKPSLHLGFKQQSTASALSLYLQATLHIDKEAQMYYVRLGSYRMKRVLSDPEITSSFIQLFTGDPELQTRWIAAPTVGVTK